MAGILIRCCLTLSLSLMASSALAQRVVADPTRPPAGLVIGQSVPGDDNGEPLAPVLQSVILPSKGKPVAIIGGLQVRLGEKYGESRLVRVNERSVFLEGPSGTEQLLLTPLVEKTEEKRSENRMTTVAKKIPRGGEK